jgi:putative acyl-CoA dehydrogenase
VIALDVLRALTRDAETLPALLAEVEPARGADARLDRWVDRCVEGLAGLGEATTQATQHTARRLVEDLALVLQGALVVRHSPAPVAEAFLAARLGGEGGRTFGTLPPGIDTAAIIDRHRPRLDP